jgi:hypothetical protein
LVVQVTGSQEQTDGPGVHVSGIFVTVPSGPTDALPEHMVYWASQVRGAEQSAAVLHACILATQIPVVLEGNDGAGHVVFAGQVGAMVGIMFGAQSKSTLGQSATVVQGISQVPVTGMGSGAGGNGPESEGD